MQGPVPKSTALTPARRRQAYDLIPQKTLQMMRPYFSRLIESTHALLEYRAIVVSRTKALLINKPEKVWLFSRLKS